MFEQKYTNDKNYCKVKGYCHYTGKYRGATHSIFNLKYSKRNIPKGIPVVFHNGSNYYYYFVIREVAKEFDWKFHCLGENTEKYKPFQFR